MYRNQKEELVSICHKLYERNLVTASDGNVSYRINEEHIILTPSGKSKGILKTEDILVVDFKGNVVEGTGRSSKEYPMHRAIYQTKEEIKAVVHTHPVYATAFALAGKNIPNNHLIEAKMMLKGCALAEYATPGTNEMVEAIKPYIDQVYVILLKNHGALTYGTSLEDAFCKMEVLESIAKTIIVSKILGEPELISEENLNKMK